MSKQLWVTLQRPPPLTLTLDKVLVEVADNLERRTDRRLNLAVRLLEPIMLLILAAIVLCVVIALLMPIMKMSSTMQR